MEAGCADAGPTAIAAMMLRACVLAVSAFRFICPELILLCPVSDARTVDTLYSRPA